MANISFYPGPSRVYSNVPEYIYEAHKDGILSINHRSDEFMSLARKAKKVLHEKLEIPDDYRILFMSSATESWEVIGQSLIRHKSQHFFNGAFGEKWCKYTELLGKEVSSHSFSMEETLPIDKLDQEADCICLTHCETSNGTYIPVDTLNVLSSQRNPDQLIAVDATSSMAGLRLPWDKADYWYASVQKCFGLPAGLGIAVLSPGAVNRAEELAEKKHYNSLLKILENEEKHQTHHTPNVLGIYLLYRTQDFSKPIHKVEEKLLNRQRYWTDFLSSFKSFDLLVQNPEVRSPTVLAVKAKKPEKVKELAKDAGFTLGNGYGPWKDSCFRIANFPAIKRREIEQLSSFLRKNFKVTKVATP